jgi:hypothetical protein
MRERNASSRYGRRRVRRRRITRPSSATNLIVDRALAVARGRLRAARVRCGRGAWRSTLLRSPSRPTRPTRAYRVPAGDPSSGARADEAALAALFPRLLRARAGIAAASESAGAVAALARRRVLPASAPIGSRAAVRPGEIDALAERVIAWARAPVARRPGVTFAGFAFGEFGLGENLRAIARACEAAKLPFDVRDVGVGLSTRQAESSLAAHVAPRYERAATVVCVNPDQLRRWTS